VSRIRIVEQRGSHILAMRDGAFAVVERRDGRLYAAGGGDRPGLPDSEDGIEAAIGESGWSDERTARATFDAVTERGDALARRLW
jgi:hypothetical protein